MAEKRLNTRIVHKHAVEADWLKATGFIPMAGELIVYDADADYSYERIKIGDGTSNVNSLPFVDDALRATLVELINAVDDKVDAVSTLVGDTSVATQITSAISSKSDVGHTHDDVYYTESEIDAKLDEINTSIGDFVDGSSVIAEATHASSADAATHASSADTATKADSATAADSATKAAQDGSGNVITDTYETKTDASAKLTSAKEYTDNELDRLVGDTSVSEQIEAAQIVYVGPTEPTDPGIQVWINTSEEGTGVIPVLPRIATITLATAGWTGSTSPYSQPVEIATVTAATKIDLQPTVAQVVSLQNDDIALMAENTNGAVTIYSFGGKPSADMTMQVQLMEVSYV